ncbi:hypothetical protein NEMBOFW57_006415 [Staphylotrichum longicolle]|uniref:Uncharacterized protein n=1 Tax=Staphylotrichum longicolle TaxID=669026 RepID=A0AAD4ET77_9PEZI|nr:hypothetical protein NEMBOFW57_006415 [Staphylotrichum longicolle]
MSRNVRQKYQPAPARATKRRDYDSSSLDLSDDDSGYSGVEDVTDSEDDDEDHVFAAEEEHIITNASRKRSEPPRPLMEDDDDDADEESEADEDDDEAEAEDVDPVDDSASWDGILSDHDEPIPAPLTSDNLEQLATPVERHVRFAGVPDSDSDSTTSETSEINDFFPDIFVEQSALDPSFRREIEHDDETSSNGSFWDFHSGSQEIGTRDAQDSDDDAAAQDLDLTPLATPRPSQPPSEAATPVAAFAEVQELDGYETDGDTTEEDIPEPIVRRKHMRRAHSVEASSDSDTERGVQYRPGKPRIGRFNLDRSDNKPIGVVDPASGKMIIFTPRRTNQLDLSPESLQLDFNQDLTCSPLVRNPGFIMMGAMVSSNPFGDFINMQPFGPAEAFFPCTPDVFTAEESDDSYFAGLEEDEDEEESLLKLEDFVTFNHDSSDEEEFGGDWNGDLISSPTRPKTAASTASAATDSAPAHPLLTHFDNNSDVGAFRRNQINQQLIYSDKASQESLAFSGPYYHGTLRGIKSGSMETVTTPITPIRRQKRSNTVGMHGFSELQQSSPLNVLSQKRKASSNLADPSIHKRHRSLSDMEVLQI